MSNWIEILLFVPCAVAFFSGAAFAFVFGPPYVVMMNFPCKLAQYEKDICTAGKWSLIIFLVSFALAIPCFIILKYFF